MARRARAQLSIGCVRARFAKHIAILILVDACVSALGFFFFGYAFGFGDPKDQSAAGAASGGAPGLTTTGGNPFVGTQFFGLHDMTPYLFASWLFQWSVRGPARAAQPSACVHVLLACVHKPFACAHSRVGDRWERGVRHQAAARLARESGSDAERAGRSAAAWGRRILAKPDSAVQEQQLMRERARAVRGHGLHDRVGCHRRARKI